MKEMILLLVTCHLIGDFYLQSDALAIEKRSNNKKLWGHFLLYAIPFTVFPILSISVFTLGNYFFGFLLCAGVVIVLHAIIDTVKIALQRLRPQINSRENILFVCDQLVHFGSIIAICFVAERMGLLPSREFIMVEVNDLNLLKIAVFLLFLGKPTNIIFKAFFDKYAEEGTNVAAVTKDGAGALIGSLERLTMGILVLLGQFAALGIVMAAKTLTRYTRMSENPRFAEYYLIGTLFSVLAVAAAYITLFHIVV